MADTNNITLIGLFTDIADAIRERLGISDRIVADEFPVMLTSIPDNSIFLSIIDKSITGLPESYLEGVTSIGNYAFYKCTNLALTSLPEGVTSIDYFAFYNCTNLKSLTFKGTPTTISSTAFVGCNNLTTINVPWSEGEVANAPWGATNATINYNYISN